MASISRPLRVIDVTTLVLKEVKWQNPNDNDGGRYAILSHTWGEDGEEVNLSEWNRKDGSDDVMAKTGYEKIMGACTLTKEARLRYLWVDTCCINKDNQNELGEAINSMFEWYANATICYALLSDVPGATTKTENVARIRISRWFTRGWTLQELIAPRNVHFYGDDWSSLGSRNKLLDVLAKVTGIDQDVLAGHKLLSECSVAQKLSWASGRETKRSEDRAYSLFGILGLTTYLAYGEGDSAFRRLQKEVLMETGDLSIFAWRHVEPPRSTSLFASHPVDFLGSGNTVLDPSRKPTRHMMANDGVESTIYVRSTIGGQNGRPDRCLVLLGCHDRHSPNTTLALRVESAGGPSGENGTLTVNPLGDPGASLLSRLESIPSVDTGKEVRVQTTMLFKGRVLSPGTNGRSESQGHNVESETTPLLGDGSREGTTPAPSRSESLAETTLQEQRAVSKSTFLRWLGGCFVLTAVAFFLVVLYVILAAEHQPHGGKDGKGTTSSASSTHSATSDSSASETVSSSRTSSIISVTNTKIPPSGTHSATSESSTSTTASSSSSKISPTSPTSAPRSTPSAIHVAGDSGIAVVSAEESSFYGYYQNSYGDIVEAEFPDASFVAIASADRNRTVVTAESTFLGTPIAATSWTSRSGTVHRALFFQNLDDMILVTNTTGTESWSEPYGILDTDLAAPEGRVLAAASDTSSTGFNGVRVYYASASGVIQEVGTDFDGSDDGISKQPWHTWFSFEKSYPQDRVGLTVSGAEVHLYLSNKMTFMMQQWRWNVRSRKQWQPGDEFWAMQAVAAAHEKTTDHETTDQVFLLDTHGGIQRTRCISGHFDGLGGTLKIADGTSASYVTAIPIYSTSGNGVMVLYHAADNPTQFSFQVVANNGTITAAGIWQSSVDLV
ncbi:hypothetical protein LTR56_001369 [Elasticomyces elasticus]|nr:hypothetical protein LTR56_001369 [Elasticomyces elasticus]KAK3667550.1 hypothetical protein LTR22_001728 [Elasticomyces elasticus]